MRNVFILYGANLFLFMSKIILLDNTVYFVDSNFQYFGLLYFMYLLLFLYLSLVLDHR